MAARVSNFKAQLTSSLRRSTGTYRSTPGATVPFSDRAQVVVHAREALGGLTRRRRWCWALPQDQGWGPPPLETEDFMEIEETEPGATFEAIEETVS